MSKTGKKSQNKNSMATFFKVLRFIGKYRFLLVLSVILAAVIWRIRGEMGEKDADSTCRKDGK